ncbi:MAG TPA: hypothetical protein VGR67_07750 [Candidatus Polarisedimenticolia bacterium]|jgi:hypothetical protein|nr:hypothetical protein [Candidatus Polarisedimenticolia bacterium]
MIDNPEQVISKELESGERLLWSGAPRRGLVIRGSDAFLIPFSLMWGGFAIFWEVSVMNSKAPGFFVLWGVPFVLIGLYLIVGRFFADAAIRGRTCYGVTDRRAIIVAGLMSRSIKSVNLRTMTDLSLSERSGGSGTIYFGPTPPWGAMYSGGRWSHQYPPAFELIEDAKRVYNVIRQAQESK